MIAHTNPAEHVTLVVVALAAAGIYAVAWWRQDPSRRTTWRLWAWTGGLVALAVSTSPDFERLAHESFTGHMVQHLLMILVAGPLLVLARPVRTLRAGFDRPAHLSPVERKVAATWRRSGPLAAPALFVGVLFVTHLTGIYDAALDSRFVHDLEHVAYLGSAIALWAAVLSAGSAAAPARVAGVFAVIAGSALLGVVLLTASVPLMDTYADQLGADRALDDQRAAASLMWVGGMALSLPLLLTAVWRWASAEQRTAEAAERLTSSAVAAGPRR